MENVLKTTNAIIWGIPVLSLILFVGIYLSVRSKFAQFRLLPLAIRTFLKSVRSNCSNEQKTSGYRALCTALAATVGTGNIAGVAGAIAIGGPGVIFWMWICAFLGMVTKFAEIVLAMHYRTKDQTGTYIGGPMYVIERGLPGKIRSLAYIYSYFGIVASFGIGNTAQVNTIIESFRQIAPLFYCEFSLNETVLLGLLIAALVMIAFRKGSRGVGNWAEKLVPFASVIYILFAIGVLCIRWRRIPDAISMILVGAFSPKTATCGVIGSAFLTLRVGAARGVFTNEAGMGTASIAHAAADVKHPVEQGFMGIVEVFLDTVVICTLTALVILCSGIPIAYGTDPGIALTMDAFSSVYGNVSRIVLSILVCIFAFATILGWGLYGVRCCQYIFGTQVWNTFVIAQAVAVVIGSILNTSTVWLLSELVNGFMAIPNLLSIILLIPMFLRILEDYQKKRNAYRLQ